MEKNLPNYLAAIDKKRMRIFVLQVPDLCAVKIEGAWQFCKPIGDEEIKEYYELVTDLKAAKKFVAEARIYLF